MGGVESVGSLSSRPADSDIQRPLSTNIIRRLVGCPVRFTLQQVRKSALFSVFDLWV